MGYEDVTVLDTERTLDFLEPIAGTPEHARAFERLIAALEPSAVLAAEPALAALDVPTLIVWGTGDEFFELSWAYWLRDAIGGARGGRRDAGRQAVLARRAPGRPRPAPPPPLERRRRTSLAQGT